MIKKKKNLTFIKKFLSHILKKGKKTKVFLNLFKLLISFESDKYSVLESVFKRIKPYVEVRHVRVRRSTNLVPFPVKLNRQYHLASLWLMETIKRDKRKVSFFVKLRDEIINILNLKGETYKKKSQVYFLALKNRSNSHYRWY